MVKIPEFCVTFARKMPEFYTIKIHNSPKIFSRFFGWGTCPLTLSPTPMNMQTFRHG